MRVFKAVSKTGLAAGLSWRPRTPFWAGCRKFTGIGLGISPVCTTTKIGVRADPWGKSRERYDWSSMENLDHGAVLLGQNLKDESTGWQLRTSTTG